MKNFFKVASGVDTLPLLSALQLKPHLWNQNDLRQSYENSPHAKADDIWLWFNELSDGCDTFNDIQTIPYPAFYELPQARSIIFDLMRRVEATQLGRCIITRLKKGDEILPHKDQGAPAEFYTRFQVALNSGKGCNFIIEDEQVNFQNGEVWMINNSNEHSVVNNSDSDRIVMIVDLRCGQ